MAGRGLLRKALGEAGQVMAAPRGPKSSGALPSTRGSVASTGVRGVLARLGVSTGVKRPPSRDCLGVTEEASQARESWGISGLAERPAAERRGLWPIGPRGMCRARLGPRRPRGVRAGVGGGCLSPGDARAVGGGRP